MGTWTLESTKNNVTPLDTTTNYGHNFRVTFTMKYTPKLGAGFTEPPRLDWHERVMKKDLTAQEWHEYELNMYTLKPQSLTLNIWSRRYWDAYCRAAGGASDPLGRVKGSSRLRAKDGRSVPLTELGAGLTEPKDQVRAVREYLKSKGGFLDIEIHDIPSIALPLSPNTSTERLLIFHVGVEGNNNLRLHAEQYLKVSSAEPKARWTQSLKVGAGQGHTWATTGLKKVTAPANLTTPLLPVFTKDVEYW